MTPSAGTAYVEFRGDWSALNREVAARVNPIAKSFGGKFGKALGPVMDQQVKHLRTFTTAARYATVGAAGLAAYGFKDIIESGAKFEKQMSVDAAVSDATRKQMGLLEKQALKLGQATFYSAGQAGEAQTELLKGGLKIKQVLGGGLAASLSLAEAGELDLAVAAETTVNAMKLFGLQGKDASSVADMLSTAANKTTADVEDFAMALKQGGSVTKLAGYDMNETVTVLEALAEAGIKNSDAGTSMKTAVIQLLKPSEKQAKLAKSLNLDFITQNGHLKDAAGLSKELRRATDDETKAERAKTFATLAGTDGVRTLNALYSETPVQLRKLEVANAKQGTAQEIAKKKMDNVAGSWEQFKGSVETAEIQIYAGMAPALGTLADEATKAANNVGAIFSNEDLSGSEKVEKAIDVLGREVGKIWERNDVTEHLFDVLDAAIPIIAEHAGKLGFEAAKGFGKGFLHADPLGKAVMATWLLHFIGGKAPFIGVAKLLGKQFGLTFAAEAVTGMAASGAAGGIASALPGVAASSRWLGTDSAPVRQTERQALAAQGGIFKNVAGGVASGGVASLIGASVIPAAVAGAGIYKIATHTGHEMGDKIAAGLGEGFEQKYGPAINKALREKDLGKLTGLRKNLRLALNLAIASGADDASLEPLRKKLASVGKLVESVQTPRLAVGSQIDTLESGLATRMQDITKLFRSNLTQINAGWIHGSDGWRKASVENMQGVIAAIKAGMAKGVIETDVGTKRIKQLMRDVRLAQGADPLKIADGFANSWRKAGQVNNQQINSAIRDLHRMPKGARDAAQDAMVQMARAMEQKGQLVKGSADRLQSALITRFGKTNKSLVHGVEGAVGAMGTLFGNLNDTVNAALGNLGLNVNAVLKGLGVKSSLDFVLKAGSAAVRGVGSVFDGVAGVVSKQDGGYIVPGSGDGDKYRTTGEVGAFVMNREATRAYGLQDGGAIPLALEAGERYFSREEVKRIGRPALEAANSMVPRFLQKGGSISEPRLGGPEPLRSAGQAGIHKVFEAAQKYVDAHSPKGGAGGAAFGPKGIGTYKGVPMANWVIEALQFAASKGAAPQPTSGYRSHAQNVSEGRTYFSEHEKTQYPGGAVDFGGFDSGLAEKLSVVAATRDFKYPLLAPIGFHDDGHASGTGHMLGGLIKALSVGGPVPPAVGELVGASYYGGPTDGVSGTVGAAGVSLPGKMSFAELAMGKALGGLDFHTKLKIGYNGKSVIAEKLDIGLGGDSVGGKNRAIDLWYETANAIGMPGTAVVKVSPADAKVSDEHSFKEDVPTVWHGLRTDSLSLGSSVPKTLHGVEKEIKQREREVGRYRAGATRAKKESKPAIEQALRQNITALESRLHQLRNARRNLRFQAAKKTFTKKTSRFGLSKVTGYETKIEGLQRDYNIADQFAQQVVGLEPIQPELAASATDAQREASEKDYVARFTDYVNSKERPAFTTVLEKEADWRNAILRAESWGFSASQPSVAYMQRDWESKIRHTDSYIDRINDYTAEVAKHITNWRSKHPEARDLPKELKAEEQRRDAMRGELPMLRFEDRELRKVLGEARGAFYTGGDHRITPPALPLEGTGSLEDQLADVQGIHWPDQHSLLPAAALAPPRIEGNFGGAIWETQGAIEELGLKITQAANSLGVPGDPGKGEREVLLEELLLQANQEKLIRAIERKTFGELPKYHSGGTVRAVHPGPQEVPIMAQVGERVRTPEQELVLAQQIREMGDRSGSHHVVVNVHEGGQVEVEVNDKQIEAVLNRINNRQARSAGRRRAGRGMGVLG